MSGRSSPEIGPSGDATLIPLNLDEQDQDSMESGDGTDGFVFAMPLIVRELPTDEELTDDRSSGQGSDSNNHQPANNAVDLMDNAAIQIGQLEAANVNYQIRVEELEKALAELSDPDLTLDGRANVLSWTPKPDQLQKLFLTSKEIDDAVDFLDLNPMEQLRYDPSQQQYANLAFIGPEENCILIDRDTFESIVTSDASFAIKGREMLLAALNLDAIPLLTLPSSGKNLNVYAEVNTSLLDSVADVILPDKNDPGRDQKMKTFLIYVKQAFIKHRVARVICID